jgi:rhamnosyltransferase subunit B
MSLFIMVTHGTAGDILQLVRLGRTLVGRGHDVLLVTHSLYADSARRAGLSFVAIDSGEEYERHLALTPDLLELRRPADLREFYHRGRLLDQLLLETDTLVGAHRPGDTVLIGRHGSALSMLLAAELTGAPAAWVALYPSQLMSAPVLEYFIEYGLGPDVNQVRARYGLDPVDRWTSWLRSPATCLALWPRWFDEAGTPAPAGTVVAGFLPGDEEGASLGADDSPATNLPTEVEDLLAHPLPPVLVTGGTGRMLHPGFYPAALAAAGAGRPTLVVTPHRDLLPARLPTGVTWVRRIWFPAVVAHFGAIVHHGGIGTAMRALAAGTPQVILAHGLDRPDNAARLAQLGLAETALAPSWQPGTVRALTERALADRGYAARARRQLAGQDDEAAADLAEWALTAKLGAGRR